MTAAMPQQPADGNPTPLPVNELPLDRPISTDLATPRSALAVAAHPDDIEFGCGATLAKWASRGCEIHHLVLSDGAKGSWDPAQDLASLVAARQGEQREAARTLGGGDVVFLGLPDGELRNGIREQWEVARWIRIVRPQVVLGHDPWRRYRLHPDHRNAGFILTDAIVAARDPHFFTDQELPPHRPDRLLLWEADVPNHVETVSGFEEIKIDALLAHRSQYQSTLGIDPLVAQSGAPASRNLPEVKAFAARVIAQLHAHGALVDVPLGECFHLIEDL